MDVLSTTELIIIAIMIIVLMVLFASSVFYIMDENEKEKAAREEKERPDSLHLMNEKQKAAYKQEKQDRKWGDPYENAKYVIQGGKVECPFCSPTFAEIFVTSTTVKLQDKPWATVDDKDGKKNFNFTGVCKHPSQQKPFSPPPPCKAVISLGAWKGFSETLIDGKNALVVQSAIPCMVSGQDLKITDSGQKAVLEKIEPERERKPVIKDVYWKENGSEEKNYVDYPDHPVNLYIETEEFKETEKAIVKFIAPEGKLYKGNKKEFEIGGNPNAEGVIIIKDFILEFEKDKAKKI